jgi:shikimate kinase
VPSPRECVMPQRIVSTRPVHNIALIGFMGTGKSTVGRMVAEMLHFTFLDTDHVIEARAGRSVADIFAHDGEAVFREWERRIVEELTRRTKTVIATGGGLPANEANLASLKTHALVVCLWASPETIWERVRGHQHRPLLKDPDPQQRIRDLLAVRAPFYRQADVLLSAGMRPAREVAAQIAHQFRAAQQVPR